MSTPSNWDCMTIASKRLLFFDVDHHDDLVQEDVVLGWMLDGDHLGIEDCNDEVDHGDLVQMDVVLGW